VVTSGGPDERADCSIAKQLAGLSFNTPAFNQVPPHFSAEYAETIPFDVICPCYQQWPDNILKMLPLLLAQLVHHYHSDAGIASLGYDNPLLLSYLWNNPDGIVLRHELHSNLRGGIYGNAELKSQLRDLQCDEFLMHVRGLVNQTILMKQFPMTPELSSALKSTNSLLNDVTNGCFQGQFPSYQSHGSGNELPAVELQPFQAAAGALPAPFPQASPPAVAASSYRPGAVLHQHQAPAALQLPQAPPAFRVPVSMDVRYAWFRYHTKGADKQGLWRDKTTQDIDPSVSGKERKTMREMFNKVLAVCRMLLGRNSQADVDYIGVEKAFDLCKTKVTNVWGYDILDNGNAAVRTVYQYMTGKSIDSFASLDIDKCKAYRQLCLDGLWVTPAVISQMDIRAAQNIISDDLTQHADIDVSAEASFGEQDPHSASDSEDPVSRGARKLACEKAAGRTVDTFKHANAFESILTESPKQPVLHAALPQTECFVCAICNPIRLFKRWAHYVLHYRGHANDEGQTCVQVPEKDEVQVALGVKLNATKTSQYRPVSQPYWKAYSTESKYQFLRRRILRRKILRLGDKIEVLFSASGESKIAVVLDPTLVVIQKAHYVRSAQYLNEDNVSLDASLNIEQVPVTSILQHWRPHAQPTHFPGANTAATSDRCAGLPQPTPPESPVYRTSDTPRSRRNSSAVQSAQKNSHSVQQFSAQPQFDCVTKTSSSRTIQPSIQSSSRRALQFRSVAETEPASSLPALKHSDASLFPLGVQIMLREISGPNKFIRVPHPFVKSTSNHYTECIGTSLKDSNVHSNVRFPLFEHNGTQFVEEDFGTKFSRVYPAHIRQIISTFNLEESNRCFFITLGIATGYDPFMLQCLFRKHAALICTQALCHQYHDAADILGDVLANDGHVDCGVLNFCWPSEFSNLRLVYICTRGKRSHVVEFSEKPITSQTKDIFFRLHDGHFTLLTRIHSTFVPPQTGTITMLHQTNPAYRCPSVSSMQFAVFDSDSAYLSSALVGNMPTTEQFNAMWLHAATHCGLEFHPDRFAWTEVPAGVQVKGSNMMGSMTPLSCKKVQSALLKTYFDTRPSLRVSHRSSLKAAQSPLKTVSQSNHPCVFLDAGSESGHFLFRMMDHPSITHVAGVEIQKAWFDISVEIFKFIRIVCISQNFRMPAVTLFNSCMLSSNHEIKYLYSTSNIVWQNNFVYHKEKFFSAEKKDRGTSRDVARAPLIFLPVRDERRYLLAANAAFFLGSHFRTTTCIAVHRPEYFNSVWNYHLMAQFEVNPTWGNSTAEVSILTHRQCISISDSHRLLCVTQEEENAFDQLLQKWSCALPFAYNVMQNTSLYNRQVLHFSGNQQSRQVKGHSREQPVLTDVDGEYIDTRDLEKLFGDILPQPFRKHALSIQDITACQSTQVMSGVVIKAYIDLLKVQFTAQIHFPADGVFDMNFLKDLLSGSEQLQADNCRKYLSSRCGIIAFIVNTGYHWVAFKVDIKKQYIAYVCSLQNPMETEARLILKAFSFMHANANTFRCFKVPAPHQQNAVDCGPLACMFLLFLTQNDITPVTKLEYSSIPTAAEMRMRMFADIRQGSVTLLAE